MVLCDYLSFRPFLWSCGTILSNARNIVSIENCSNQTSNKPEHCEWCYTYLIALKTPGVVFHEACSKLTPFACFTESCTTPFAHVCLKEVASRVYIYL